MGVISRSRDGRSCAGGMRLMFIIMVVGRSTRSGGTIQPPTQKAADGSAVAASSSRASMSGGKMRSSSTISSFWSGAASRIAERNLVAGPWSSSSS